MRLFIFGLGYSALAFARRATPAIEIAGTVTTVEKRDRLNLPGVTARLFDGEAFDPSIMQDLARADALLASVPPDENGDPVLRRFSDAIASAPRLRFIGYLSTVGVYGDHGGGWVDETTVPMPVSDRSRRRLDAERRWEAVGSRSGKPVHILRLAGIYGPGSNALVNVRAGRARRIIKPGQIFNRIHVDDIAAVVMAALRYEGDGRVWNVADDEPSPPEDVIVHAAELLGVPPPPEIDFERAEFSPMGRSFWGESKRVSNARIRGELGVVLAYPTYREGLAALMRVDGAAPLDQGPHGERVP